MLDVVPQVRPRNPNSIYFRHLDLTDRRVRAAASASQRARLLDAMTRAVAGKGYAKVTVTDVVALAEVSRRTFYEQFADKEECFLEAYSTGSDAMIEDIADAVRASGASDWRERVRVGVGAYTSVLAAEPDLARTLLVDVLGAGPQAVELRRRVFDRFTDLYRPSPTGKRPADEALRAVPEPYLRGLVGAISELVAEHILTDGAHSLGRLTPTLVDLAQTVLAAGARAR